MSGMIQPPTTYAEWVELLNMLEQKTDDENVRTALKQGKIAWQSGVAERFAKKLIDTVNARLDAAAEKFQKEISRANGQERAIVQALLSLRKELSFLLDIMDMPALPKKDRVHYCSLVREHADRMQSSLESSARSDRSGKMSVLIRNYKINEI
ncbi:MAG: hypothetical protein FWG68_12875 [Defluviitaleaceae bacterium]|nr:hypothetical protein [Defluviitaleaceae bacterium]